MTSSRSLALVMGLLLARPFPVPPSTPLGVVAEASRVRLNSAAVSVGTTVYDGDRFSTEEGGGVLLRGEGVTIELAEQSEMRIFSRPTSSVGTDAELTRGTLRFRSAPARGLAVTALGAHLSLVGDERTTARISISNPKELTVFAHGGSLQVSYRGQTETISPGTTFRLVLDPPDDGRTVKPERAARMHKTFLLIALGGAAAGGAVLFNSMHHHHRVESPDRP